MQIHRGQGTSEEVKSQEDWEPTKKVMCDLGESSLNRVMGQNPNEYEKAKA